MKRKCTIHQLVASIVHVHCTCLCVYSLEDDLANLAKSLRVDHELVSSLGERFWAIVRERPDGVDLVDQIAEGSFS